MADAPLLWSIEFLGEPAVAVALQRFQHEIEDWRPFWDDYFAPAWFRHMTNQFETEGRATGEAWAPLSANYERWKRKHYPGRKILERTGRLRAALTDRRAEGAIFDSNKDQLTIGVHTPYAIFHQLGTGPRGRSSGRKPVKGYEYGTRGGGMPARPPLRMGGDTFRLLVGKLLQQFGHDVAKKSGL